MKGMLVNKIWTKNNWSKHSYHLSVNFINRQHDCWVIAMTVAVEGSAVEGSTMEGSVMEGSAMAKLWWKIQWKAVRWPSGWCNGRQHDGRQCECWQWAVKLRMPALTASRLAEVTRLVYLICSSPPPPSIIILTPLLFLENFFLYVTDAEKRSCATTLSLCRRFCRIEPLLPAKHSWSTSFLFFFSLSSSSCLRPRHRRPSRHPTNPSRSAEPTTTTRPSEKLIIYSFHRKHGGGGNQ